MKTDEEVLQSYPYDYTTYGRMYMEKDCLKAMQEYATAKVKETYPELIQTLKDLKEVLIEAKLTIHAKGIEELLKKYE